MSVKLYLLSLFIILFYSVTNAQKDTIVDGIRYNHISYHSNGKIHELGNYSHEGHAIFKHGYWKVFDAEGLLVEKGTFNRNEKIEVWTECVKGRTYCWIGPYQEGRKEGKWFDGGTKFAYYDNGNFDSVVELEWEGDEALESQPTRDSIFFRGSSPITTSAF